MKKIMYSLMLSEDVIAEVDRLAYETGTNRSSLINNILAEYVSYRTPEMRMKEMFETMENLLSSYSGLKVTLRSSDSLFNLRSALTFKYNPTVNYSIELYRTVSDAVGELRAGLRTQNPNLKLYIMQFYKLWARIESSYSSNIGDYAINGEKFIKRLSFNKDKFRSDRQSPAEFTENMLCEAIVGYVNAFDSALKAFFYNLDDANEAVKQVEAVYSNYRSSGPIII